jgi:hypothetical protein
MVDVAGVEASTHVTSSVVTEFMVDVAGVKLAQCVM